MATIAQIESETRLLVDADTVSYPAADLLRRENAAYEETVGDILGMDGLWQFDDTRYTSFPIATTSLVASQRDYSFDTSMLEIEKVAILSASDGLYHFIDPFDISNLSDPVETINQTNGLPTAYDKQGGSLILDIAPSATDVTLAAGLKVYFKRTASVFTTAEQTAGTAVPGFYSPCHYILSYKSALPFAMAYKPDRVAMIRVRIVELEKKLQEHYGRREQDRKKVMTMKPISFE